MLKHIAIIMDGNGRWAKQRLLPRVAGHKKGADAARATITVSPELGVEFLTLYAFSSENWQRPKEEVQELMGLLAYYLDKHVRELHENNVRIRFIGNREKLSADIQDKMQTTEQLTAANTGLQLQVALSYGGREELVNAARQLAEKVKSGEIKAEQIDEETLAAQLYTAGIPDPDLLIRTGGEQRISNYLLWQCAYAELYFTDTLWPDFDKKTLQAAIDDFAQRERRFGKISEQLATAE